MIQTLKDIIKDNFPALLAVWEKRPFVILSLGLLILSGVLGKQWWDVNEEKNDLAVLHHEQLDSLRLENHNLNIQLNNCIKDYSKYKDYNVIIDSTLKTLFINNLLKKNTNE